MILVVDDDPSVREAVVTTLESDGYEVQAVSDGSSALAAVSEHSFDAMVLDVMMPGIDGLAVCRILREQGNRIPILVLTARSEVGDRIAGLDAGADDCHLPSPLTSTNSARGYVPCYGGQRHRNPRCSSGFFSRPADTARRQIRPEHGLHCNRVRAAGTTHRELRPDAHP